MTIQEVFDKAVRGLRDQGWRKASVGGDWISGACKYRTSSGLRCAIGHVIPDEKYSPKLEGRSAYDVAHHIGLVIEDMPSGFFLNRLQECHDQALNRLDMHRRFRAFAARYGLEFPADCLAPEITGVEEGEQGL